MVFIFHLIESEPLTFLQRRCQVQSQKICSSSDGLLSAMVPLVLLFLKPNVWIGFRSASAPNGLGGPLDWFCLSLAGEPLRFDWF